MKVIFSAFLLVLLGLAAVFGWAAYEEIVHNECGLTKEQARESALEEVNRMKLPSEYLARSPHYSSGSCGYSFIYEGAGKKIDFMILSTWLHGVKITWWDFARDEQ
ncbi:hypothetical protein A167_01700 [Alcanivorax sp. S71-1-4]|uniref:hypothetical protein n=1 Tax=Alcanivorax sp. S71-1-4 TaxID=1177159 RepID=UPI00135AF658|nr:hypothetical protein [Alcanivorax sp. S71-1-4]KAF0809629.1 hypothetical protein A167_01700 [Alcanivorax sp. S71-1-4]